MSRLSQPTVRQLPPVRRLLAGALLTGTVAAAAPAAASAAPSTCVYNPDNKNLVIDDKSGIDSFRLVRLGGQIRIADGNEAPRFCAVPGQFAVATVANTERIPIFRGGGGENLAGGVHIDQSQGAFAPGATPELDGQSEIEIVVNDSSPAFLHNNTLRVTGTPQRDEIKVGVGANMNLTPDADIDLTLNRKPEDVRVAGGDGDDLIRSTGLRADGVADPLMRPSLDGDGGNDILTGGRDREDFGGGAGAIASTASTVRART